MGLLERLSRVQDKAPGASLQTCAGRMAFSDRPAECGHSVTHPPHSIGTVPFGAHPMSPFVQRAMAGTLPGKVIR